MESMLEIVVDFGEHFEDSITGSTSWPVIDQSFIDDYCKSQAITESQLKNAIRQYCIYGNYSSGSYEQVLEQQGHSIVSFEMAVVAIQIYAATKRERDEEITEKNYRDRLAQVLNCEIQDIERWFIRYQDYVWKTFYDYCNAYEEDINYDYRSVQCVQKSGYGRYVQYPLKYAERIFTTEDLKYIAGFFAHKHIYPEEVISLLDFRRIIKESDINRWCNTSHGQTVLSNCDTANIFQQVFSFYLRWNGEYKSTSGKDSKLPQGQFSLFLMEDRGNYCLEIRYTNNLTLKERISIQSLTLKKLKSESYHAKRPNILVFQQSPEGYWQEVRYIDDKEQPGLLILFVGQLPSYQIPTICGDLILSTSELRLYKIQYEEHTQEFYSVQDKLFQLVGGLRVGYMTYLQGVGGAPILQLKSPVHVIIDGKIFKYASNVIKTNSQTNYKDEGNKHELNHNINYSEIYYEASRICDCYFKPYCVERKDTISLNRVVKEMTRDKEYQDVLASLGIEQFSAKLVLDWAKEASIVNKDGLIILITRQAQKDVHGNAILDGKGDPVFDYKASPIKSWTPDKVFQVLASCIAVDKQRKEKKANPAIKAENKILYNCSTVSIESMRYGRIYNEASAILGSIIMPSVINKTENNNTSLSHVIKELDLSGKLKRFQNLLSTIGVENLTTTVFLHRAHETSLIDLKGDVGVLSRHIRKDKDGNAMRNSEGQIISDFEIQSIKSWTQTKVFQVLATCIAVRNLKNSEKTEGESAIDMDDNVLVVEDQGNKECIDISLDTLSAGLHSILISGCKEIKIKLVDSLPTARVWMRDSNRWYVDKSSKWESQDPRECNEPQDGIVGLDFSSIPQKPIVSEEPTLTRWSKMLTLGQPQQNENNITLRILKQTRL